MDAKAILQKFVVVEGHRDVYEQLYGASLGEPSPVRDAVAFLLHFKGGMPLQGSIHQLRNF